jgi:hypothetical protein
MAFNDKELESFVNGLLRAKNEMYNYKPDMILAPMLGSVPLIDCLNAIDCGFDNEKVFYVPASSSINHVKELISKTISNILEDRKINLESLVNEKYKIMGIDEVVGGGSCGRRLRPASQNPRPPVNPVAPAKRRSWSSASRRRIRSS